MLASDIFLPSFQLSITFELLVTIAMQRYKTLITLISVISIVIDNVSLKMNQQRNILDHVTYCLTTQLYLDYAQYFFTYDNCCFIHIYTHICIHIKQKSMNKTKSIEKVKSER